MKVKLFLKDAGYFALITVAGALSLVMIVLIIKIFWVIVKFTWNLF